MPSLLLMITLSRWALVVQVALELFPGSLQHNESVPSTVAGAVEVRLNGSVDSIFGVYDGHGGAHVSHLLSQRLHRHLLRAQVDSRAAHVTRELMHMHGAARRKQFPRDFRRGFPRNG